MQPQQNPQQNPQQTPVAPVAPPVQQDAPSVLMPAPSAVPPKKGMTKGRKIIIGIVAAVTVMAGLGAFLLFPSMEAPLKVSDQFVDALQSNNASAAYALTAQEFKDSATEGELATVIAEVSPIIENGARSVEGRKISISTTTKSTAVLVYKIAAKDEGSLYVRVITQKDNDEWRVLNFRSSRSELAAEIE